MSLKRKIGASVSITATCVGIGLSTGCSMSQDPEKNESATTPTLDAVVNLPDQYIGLTVDRDGTIALARLDTINQMGNLALGGLETVGKLSPENQDKLNKELGRIITIADMGSIEERAVIFENHSRAVDCVVGTLYEKGTEHLNTEIPDLCLNVANLVSAEFMTITSNESGQPTPAT